ncbi:zinc finger and SCAN domain-containing protein 25-like isoform X2 [Nerophis ophidion]|uniref:zinc finger and SCAN domain-containing protein 25-like isoform X2 n=1 Tax=Nerophis ophidion TaxID=159077 RepID=UPI002ADF11A8|nr:zinc finger and SCAN domain-containing protein 25-like isoform X2 [Nerophis ophidion]
MTLEPEDRAFVFAYRLRDAATRWLRPNGQDPGVLESIVLERFLDAIPARTSAWVRYHSPPSVKAAVRLAEEHLAVQREATPRTAAGSTPRDGGVWRGPDHPGIKTRFPVLRREGFPRRGHLNFQGWCAGGADNPVTCAGIAP